MNVDLSWQLTWAGETWSIADLSTSEVALLTLLLADEWKVLNPASSPVALMTHIAVHSAHVLGIEYEKVRDEVSGTRYVDLLAALGTIPAAT